MKELHKTEHGIPSWPEFNEYSDGYVVKGFCKELMDEDAVTALLIFAFFIAMGFTPVAHAVINGALGIPVPGILYFVLFFAIPFSCCHWARNHYGKETRITFLEEEIQIQGRTKGRFPVLKDQVVFRMRPHEKVRFQRNVKPIEVDKIRDYGEIVMEYGLQTYEVCNIADLRQAQNFTRVLNEAFKRSQAMKVKLDPFQADKRGKTDPDRLPE